MSASVLSVRVDASIKESFAELCEELGMTSSVAVNMFMRQMLRERSLPFVPSLSTDKEEGKSGILTIEEIKTAVVSAASSRKAIRSVTLFGSYARHDARVDSDIDLRIELDPTMTFGLFALSSFGEEIKEATGKNVDVVSSEQLREDIALAIAEEGVVLYVRS